ncbi:MAG: hypothetical protein QM713_12345 [Arachnia sp.]
MSSTKRTPTSSAWSSATSLEASQATAGATRKFTASTAPRKRASRTARPISPKGTPRNVA